MIWLVIFAGVLYVSLIFVFWIGWETLKPFQSSIPASTFVSIIIPMRNEEQNIRFLLEDLCKQIYDPHLLEIIVVDDHSTDDSIKEASNFKTHSVKIFKLSESDFGKKKALEYGIQKSSGELIITTDADCRVGEMWLATFAGYYEKHKPKLMMAPVCGKYENLFTKFQALEMFSLQGSTAGAASIHHPIMCNGANLSFPKSIFPEINHIYSNEEIHSGDDMFVLQHLKRKYPEQIHYLKSIDGTVQTKLSSTIQSFFKQRSRWAAKAVFYNDFDILASGFIVLLINLILLFTFIFGILNLNYWYFGILLFAKSFVDFILIYRTARYFNQQHLMVWFPIVQCVYFLYVCFTAFSSLAQPKVWKERIIKH